MTGEHRMRRAVATVALVAAVIGLLASGCKTSSACNPGDAGCAAPNTTVLPANTNVVENNDPARIGGKIVYALGAETNSWNPSNAQWASQGIEVARAIFDTLSAYDENLDIKPNLAEKFTPNATFTEWVITLRPNIRFHNGKPVTGEAVSRSLNFLKSSKLTSAPFDPIDSISSRGELDVVVRTKQPWANFPYALATQIGVVTDPDWLASGNTKDPVGTGPFKYVDWTPNEVLRVKKNTDYWRKDSRGTAYPYLDEVEFRIVPDDQSRTALLEQGRANIIQAGSPREIVKLKESNQFQLFNGVVGETSEYFVQLNTTEPPLDDPLARRALALATDKNAYIQNLNDGLYEPANGPFPPSSRWYVQTDYPQFDQAAARVAVDQVKAKNGGQFAFTLIGSPTPSTQEAMQYLQQVWGQVGITVTLQTYQQLDLILNVLTGKYQAAMWQQFESPHPLGDSVWWHPDSAKARGDTDPSLNFARNKDPEIGKALDSARATPDKAQELRDYQTVQKRLAIDIPYIWLYHSQQSVVADLDLVNVVNYTLPDGSKGLPLQSGTQPLFQVWLQNQS